MPGSTKKYSSVANFTLSDELKEDLSPSVVEDIEALDRTLSRYRDCQVFAASETVRVFGGSWVLYRNYLTSEESQRLNELVENYHSLETATQRATGAAPNAANPEPNPERAALFATTNTDGRDRALVEFRAVQNSVLYKSYAIEYEIKVLLMTSCVRRDASLPFFLWENSPSTGQAGNSPTRTFEKQPLAEFAKAQAAISVASEVGLHYQEFVPSSRQQFEVAKQLTSSKQKLDEIKAKLNDRGFGRVPGRATGNDNDTVAAGEKVVRDVTNVVPALLKSSCQPVITASVAPSEGGAFAIEDARYISLTDTELLALYNNLSEHLKQVRKLKATPDDLARRRLGFLWRKDLSPERVAEVEQKAEAVIKDLQYLKVVVLHEMQARLERTVDVKGGLSYRAEPMEKVMLDSDTGLQRFAKQGIDITNAQGQVTKHPLWLYNVVADENYFSAVRSDSLFMTKVRRSLGTEDIEAYRKHIDEFIAEGAPIARVDSEDTPLLASGQLSMATKVGMWFKGAWNYVTRKSPPVRSTDPFSMHHAAKFKVAKQEMDSKCSKAAGQGVLASVSLLAGATEQVRNDPLIQAFYNSPCIRVLLHKLEQLSGSIDDLVNAQGIKALVFTDTDGKERCIYDLLFEQARLEYSKWRNSVFFAQISRGYLRTIKNQLDKVFGFHNPLIGFSGFRPEGDIHNKLETAKPRIYESTKTRTAASIQALWGAYSAKDNLKPDYKQLVSVYQQFRRVQKALMPGDDYCFFTPLIKKLLEEDIISPLERQGYRTLIENVQSLFRIEDYSDDQVFSELKEQCEVMLQVLDVCDLNVKSEHLGQGPRNLEARLNQVFPTMARQQRLPSGVVTTKNKMLLTNLSERYMQKYLFTEDEAGGIHFNEAALTSEYLNTDVIKFIKAYGTYGEQRIPSILTQGRMLEHTGSQTTFLEQYAGQLRVQELRPTAGFACGSDFPTVYEGIVVGQIPSVTHYENGQAYYPANILQIYTDVIPDGLSINERVVGADVKTAAKQRLVARKPEICEYVTRFIEVVKEVKAAATISARGIDSEYRYLPYRHHDIVRALGDSKDIVDYAYSLFECHIHCDQFKNGLVGYEGGRNYTFHAMNGMPADLGPYENSFIVVNSRQQKGLFYIEANGVLKEIKVGEWGTFIAVFDELRGQGTQLSRSNNEIEQLVAKTKWGYIPYLMQDNAFIKKCLADDRLNQELSQRYRDTGLVGDAGKTLQQLIDDCLSKKITDIGLFPASAGSTDVFNREIVSVALEYGSKELLLEMHGMFLRQVYYSDCTEAKKQHVVKLYGDLLRSSDNYAEKLEHDIQLYSTRCLQRILNDTLRNEAGQYKESDKDVETFYRCYSSNRSLFHTYATDELDIVYKQARSYACDRYQLQQGCEPEAFELLANEMVDEANAQGVVTTKRSSADADYFRVHGQYARRLIVFIYKKYLESSRDLLSPEALRAMLQLFAAQTGVASQNAAAGRSRNVTLCHANYVKFFFPDCVSNAEVRQKYMTVTVGAVSAEEAYFAKCWLACTDNFDLKDIVNQGLIEELLFHFECLVNVDYEEFQRAINVVTSQVDMSENPVFYNQNQVNIRRKLGIAFAGQNTASAQLLKTLLPSILSRESSDGRRWMSNEDFSQIMHGLREKMFEQVNLNLARKMVEYRNTLENSEPKLKIVEGQFLAKMQQILTGTIDEEARGLTARPEETRAKAKEMIDAFIGLRTIATIAPATTVSASEQKARELLRAIGNNINLAASQFCDAGALRDLTSLQYNIRDVSKTIVLFKRYLGYIQLNSASPPLVQSGRVVSPCLVMGEPLAPSVEAVVGDDMSYSAATGATTGTGSVYNQQTAIMHTIRVPDQTYVDLLAPYQTVFNLNKTNPSEGLLPGAAAVIIYDNIFFDFINESVALNIHDFIYMTNKEQASPMLNFLKNFRGKLLTVIGTVLEERHPFLRAFDSFWKVIEQGRYAAEEDRDRVRYFHDFYRSCSVFIRQLYYGFPFEQALIAQLAMPHCNRDYLFTHIFSAAPEQVLAAPNTHAREELLQPIIEDLISRRTTFSLDKINAHIYCYVPALRPAQRRLPSTVDKAREIRDGLLATQARVISVQVMITALQNLKFKEALFQYFDVPESEQDTLLDSDSFLSVLGNRHRFNEESPLPAYVSIELECAILKCFDYFSSLLALSDRPLVDAGYSITSQIDMSFSAIRALFALSQQHCLNSDVIKQRVYHFTVDIKLFLIKACSENVNFSELLGSPGGSNSGLKHRARERLKFAIHWLSEFGSVEDKQWLKGVKENARFLFAKAIIEENRYRARRISPRHTVMALVFSEIKTGGSSTDLARLNTERKSDPNATAVKGEARKIYLETIHHRMDYRSFLTDLNAKFSETYPKLLYFVDFLFKQGIKSVDHFFVRINDENFVATLKKAGINTDVCIALVKPLTNRRAISLWVSVLNAIAENNSLPLDVPFFVSYGKDHDDRDKIEVAYPYARALCDAITDPSFADLCDAISGVKLAFDSPTHVCHRLVSVKQQEARRFDLIKSADLAVPHRYLMLLNRAHTTLMLARQDLAQIADYAVPQGIINIEGFNVVKSGTQRHIDYLLAEHLISKNLWSALNDVNSESRKIFDAILLLREQSLRIRQLIFIFNHMKKSQITSVDLLLAPVNHRHLNLLLVEQEMSLQDIVVDLRKGDASKYKRYLDVLVTNGMPVELNDALPDFVAIRNLFQSTQLMKLRDFAGQFGSVTSDHLSETAQAGQQPRRVDLCKQKLKIATELELERDKFLPLSLLIQEIIQLIEDGFYTKATFLIRHIVVQYTPVELAAVVDYDKLLHTLKVSVFNSQRATSSQFSAQLQELTQIESNALNEFLETELFDIIQGLVLSQFGQRMADVSFEAEGPLRTEFYGYEINRVQAVLAALARIGVDDVEDRVTRCLAGCLQLLKDFHNAVAANNQGVTRYGFSAALRERLRNFAAKVQLTLADKPEAEALLTDMRHQLQVRERLAGKLREMSELKTWVRQAKVVNVPTNLVSVEFFQFIERGGIQAKISGTTSEEHANRRIQRIITDATLTELSCFTQYICYATTDAARFTRKALVRFLTTSENLSTIICHCITLNADDRQHTIKQLLEMCVAFIHKFADVEGFPANLLDHMLGAHNQELIQYYTNGSVTALIGKTDKGAAGPTKAEMAEIYFNTYKEFMDIFHEYHRGGNVAPWEFQLNDLKVHLTNLRARTVEGLLAYAEDIRVFFREQLQLDRDPRNLLNCFEYLQYDQSGNITCRQGEDGCPESEIGNAKAVIVALKRNSETGRNFYSFNKAMILFKHMSSFLFGFDAASDKEHFVLQHYQLLRTELLAALRSVTKYHSEFAKILRNTDAVFSVSKLLNIFNSLKSLIDSDEPECRNAVTSFHGEEKIKLILTGQASGVPASSGCKDGLYRPLMRCLREGNFTRAHQELVALLQHYPVVTLDVSAILAFIFQEGRSVGLEAQHVSLEDLRYLVGNNDYQVTLPRDLTPPFKKARSEELYSSAELFQQGHGILMLVRSYIQETNAPMFGANLRTEQEFQDFIAQCTRERDAVKHCLGQVRVMSQAIRTIADAAQDDQKISFALSEFSLDEITYLKDWVANDTQAGNTEKTGFPVALLTKINGLEPLENAYVNVAFTHKEVDSMADFLHRKNRRDLQTKLNKAIIEDVAVIKEALVLRNQEVMRYLPNFLELESHARNLLAEIDSVQVNKQNQEYKDVKRKLEALMQGLSQAYESYHPSLGGMSLECTDVGDVTVPDPVQTDPARTKIIRANLKWHTLSTVFQTLENMSKGLQVSYDAFSAKRRQVVELGSVMKRAQKARSATEVLATEDCEKPVLELRQALQKSNLQSAYCIFLQIVATFNDANPDSLAMALLYGESDQAKWFRAHYIQFVNDHHIALASLANEQQLKNIKKMIELRHPAEGAGVFAHIVRACQVKLQAIITEQYKTKTVLTDDPAPYAAILSCWQDNTFAAARDKFYGEQSIIIRKTKQFRASVFETIVAYFNGKASVKITVADMERFMDLSSKGFLQDRTGELIAEPVLSAKFVAEGNNAQALRQLCQRYGVFYGSIGGWQFRDKTNTTQRLCSVLRRLAYLSLDVIVGFAAEQDNPFDINRSAFSGILKIASRQALLMFTEIDRDLIEAGTTRTETTAFGAVLKDLRVEAEALQSYVNANLLGVMQRFNDVCVADSREVAADLQKLTSHVKDNAQYLKSCMQQEHASGLFESEQARALPAAQRLRDLESQLAVERTLLEQQLGDCPQAFELRIQLFDKLHRWINLGAYTAGRLTEIRNYQLDDIELTNRYSAEIELNVAEIKRLADLALQQPAHVGSDGNPSPGYVEHQSHKDVRAALVRFRDAVEAREYHSLLLEEKTLSQELRTKASQDLLSEQKTLSAKCRGMANKESAEYAVAKQRLDRVRQALDIRAAIKFMDKRFETTEELPLIRKIMDERNCVMVLKLLLQERDIDNLESAHGYELPQIEEIKGLRARYATIQAGNALVEPLTTKLQILNQALTRVQEFKTTVEAPGHVMVDADLYCLRQDLTDRMTEALKVDLQGPISEENWQKAIDAIGLQAQINKIGDSATNAKIFSVFQALRAAHPDDRPFINAFKALLRQSTQYNQYVQLFDSLQQQIDVVAGETLLDVINRSESDTVRALLLPIRLAEEADDAYIARLVRCRNEQEDKVLFANRLATVVQGNLSDVDYIELLRTSCEKPAVIFANCAVSLLEQQIASTTSTRNKLTVEPLERLERAIVEKRAQALGSVIDVLATIFREHEASFSAIKATVEPVLKYRRYLKLLASYNQRRANLVDSFDLPPDPVVADPGTPPNFKELHRQYRSLNALVKIEMPVVNRLNDAVRKFGEIQPLNLRGLNARRQAYKTAVDSALVQLNAVQVALAKYGNIELIELIQVHAAKIQAAAPSSGLFARSVDPSRYLESYRALAQCHAVVHKFKLEDAQMEQARLRSCSVVPVSQAIYEHKLAVAVSSASKEEEHYADIVREHDHVISLLQMLRGLDDSSLADGLSSIEAIAAEFREVSEVECLSTSWSHDGSSLDDNAEEEGACEMVAAPAQAQGGTDIRSPAKRDGAWNLHGCSASVSGAGLFSSGSLDGSINGDRRSARSGPGYRPRSGSATGTQPPTPARRGPGSGSQSGAS